jgi:hypothetical protein
MEFEGFSRVMSPQDSWNKTGSQSTGLFWPTCGNDCRFYWIGD